MDKKRLRWVDACKGLAILLVVMGHVVDAYLSANMYVEWNSLMGRIHAFIYTFHMPLFFALSGYVFYKAYCKNRQEKKRSYVLQVANLVCVYFLFCLLQWVVKMIFADTVNTAYTLKDLLLIPIKPMQQFWFLYVLIFLYLIAYQFERLKINEHLKLLLTVVIAIGGSFIVGYYIFPIANLLEFFAFFYLGLYLAKEPETGLLKKQYMIIGIIISLISLFCAVYFNKNLLEIPAVGIIVSAIIVLTIFNLFINFKGLGEISPLCGLGKRTLTIYTIHCFAIGGLRVVLQAIGIQNFFLASSINFVVAFLVSLFAYWILNKLKIFDLVYRPVTFFLALKQKIDEKIETSSTQINVEEAVDDKENFAEIEKQNSKVKKSKIGRFFSKHAKWIDVGVYVLLGLFFIIHICTFDFSRAKGEVVFSFFLIGFFSLFRIMVSPRTISLSKVFYIFFFIFVFYAPLQQYLTGTVFWVSARVSYTDEDYLKANMLLILFLILFEFCYTFVPLFLRRYFPKRKKEKKSNFILKQGEPNKYADWIMVGASLIGVLFLAVTGNLFSTSSLADTNLGAQVIKIVRFFPVSCFLISFFQNKAYGKRIDKKTLVFATEILLIYFPLYGSISRFFLFGVYLTLIAAFLGETKIKSWYFLMYVVGFLFVFPAFNYFKTHDFSDLAGFQLEFVNFCFVDYDAYQLFMLTMKYCEDVGVTYGLNLLTALLSFVPRSLWSGKMFPSGEVVSEYYGAKFTNLSCPWFAEWYFSFGVIGIVVGAMFTGFLLGWLDGLWESKNWFAKSIYCTLTGYLIFLLRGALLPTIAFFVAFLLCMLFVYVLRMFLDKISTSIERKKLSKVREEKDRQEIDDKRQ